MKGKFITFEGCDGVGKSTQIRFLKSYLEENGEDVLLLREPGGTDIAEKIRAVILDNANVKMLPTCELLLYYASRAQLIDEVIRPALDNGQTVICDRFTDSSLAYQGYARGIGVEYVASLTNIVCKDIMPDATVFIDLPPESAFRKRGLNGDDRIESEGLAFQQKVYQGFKKAAEMYPDRFISVKPDFDKSVTFQRIITALQNKGIIS